MEDVYVTLKSEKIQDGIVVREISCKSDRGKHELTQLQMVNWPDFGVPDDPNHVLNIVDLFEETGVDVHGILTRILTRKFFYTKFI